MINPISNNNSFSQNVNNTISKNNTSLNEHLILTFFDGRQISFETYQMREISPDFLAKHLGDEKIVLPDWITVEDMTSFIAIYQKGVEYITEYTDKEKLLKISEFFQNESFTFSLISDVIMPRLTIENSLGFLSLTYDKLKVASKANGEIDNIWFDFFIKCLDIVGKNLSYYFKKGKSNDISNFDVKILDELYEKFSAFLITSNYVITEDVALDTLRGSAILLSNLQVMIAFLMKSRAQKSFFDLLTNEYMKICSEENINELNTLPNPTFLLKINSNEIESYYEEYKVDISMNLKQIVFVVFYRKSDDSFNVAFKLVEYSNYNNNNPKNSSFRIVTFISSVIIDEISNRQINVKSISNNKSMHSIYKINNVKNLLHSSIGNDSHYITLKIFLKPCFIHSMLTSYLLYNFNELYNQLNIQKISKQLLVLVLKNKHYGSITEDKIVISLLNWRKYIILNIIVDDEINIREDITEIVEYIKWENVSLHLLFEFIIKYGKNISSEDIEHIFIQAFENRAKGQNGLTNSTANAPTIATTSQDDNKYFNKFVMEELISKNINKFYIEASKKINYPDLFSENKKLNKLNTFNTSNFLKESSNYYSNLNTRSNENLINKKCSRHNKSFSITSEKSKYSVDSKKTSKVENPTEHIKQHNYLYKNITKQNNLNKSHGSLQTLSNYSTKPKNPVKPRLKEREFFLNDISSIHNHLNTSSNVLKKKASVTKIKPIISYMTTSTNKSMQKRSTSNLQMSSKKLHKSKSRDIFKVPIFLNKK